jgi:hypothetical protein
MTAQHDKRMTHLNEQTSNASIKDSLVASIKQTIANDEAKSDNDNSFNSDRQAKNAVLPEIDHEKSKAKINDLLFNPSECDSTILAESLMKNKVIDGYGGDYNEVYASDISDINSFDNRNK